MAAASDDQTGVYSRLERCFDGMWVGRSDLNAISATAFAATRYPARCHRAIADLLRLRVQRRPALLQEQRQALLQRQARPHHASR